MMNLTVEKACQLQEWLERTDELEAMNNEQLADLIEDHLWADLPVMTPVSDVLSEVIDRLRRGI